MRRISLGQDVGDVARVAALATRDRRIGPRRDDARLERAAAWRGAYRERQVGGCGDRPYGARRHIDRVRFAVERRHTLAELAKVLAVDTDLALASHEHQAHLAVVLAALDEIGRLELPHIEPHIGPAGVLRRVVMAALDVAA